MRGKEEKKERGKYEKEKEKERKKWGSKAFFQSQRADFFHMRSGYFFWVEKVYCIKSAKIVCTCIIDLERKFNDESIRGLSEAKCPHNP